MTYISSAFEQREDSIPLIGTSFAAKQVLGIKIPAFFFTTHFHDTFSKDMNTTSQYDYIPCEQGVTHKEITKTRGNVFLKPEEMFFWGL